MLYLYLDLKEPSKVYVFYASKAIVKDRSRLSYRVIYRLIFYVQIVARFSECYNRVCGILIILLSIELFYCHLPLKKNFAAIVI